MEGAGVFDDAFGGLEAFIHFGHQRHADAAGAGVDALGLAGQQASGQDGDVARGHKPGGKRHVGTAVERASRASGGTNSLFVVKSATGGCPSPYQQIGARKTHTNAHGC